MEQIVKQRKSALFAVGLAGLLCAAEADEREAARFLGSETGANTVVGVESDVAVEFGGEVVFGATGTEEAAET
jgi:hypothetical protein